MKKYYLNLVEQSNGDYEVHAEACYFQPKKEFEYLGWFFSCEAAVITAKARHPRKKINGCKTCSNDCHTS